LIVATTSDYKTLKDFGLTHIFEQKLRVDPVQDIGEMKHILTTVQAFDPRTIEKVCGVLGNWYPNGMDLPIKDLLLYFSQARRRGEIHRQQYDQTGDAGDAVDSGIITQEELRIRMATFLDLIKKSKQE
jgi:hypothetical protein